LLDRALGAAGGDALAPRALLLWPGTHDGAMVTAASGKRASLSGITTKSYFDFERPSSIVCATHGADPESGSPVSQAVRMPCTSDHSTQ
jgi:hypothetical protein